MSIHLLNHLQGRGHTPRSLSHRAARLSASLLLAASLACGRDSTAPVPIEGTYTLQTIDGRPLPAAIAQDAGVKDEITAGSITLVAGSAFTLNLAVRETSGSQVLTMTAVVQGTWTRSGATVTITTPDGVSTSGVLSGRTLTLAGVAGGGVVPWVFRK